MRKIIISVMVVTTVVMLISFGTFALFSDTETSSNNTFRAGSVSLAWFIDNGLVMDGVDVPVFVYEDVKPGFNQTHLLTYYNVGLNPGNLVLDIKNLKDAENVIMEPEAQAGDITDPDGELDTNLRIFMWNDLDYDRVYEPPVETILYDGTVAGMPAAFPLGVVPSAGWPFYDIGIRVTLPVGTGNEVMTDSCGFDLVGTLSQL